MKQNSTVLNLKKLAGSDRPYGNQLGRKVYQAASQIISAHPAESVFCISLKGIQTTDASFPRESIVALAKSFRGEKGFWLADISSRDLIDNWHYAAEAKEQPLVIWENGSYEIIGPAISLPNKKILDFIYKNKKATTSVLSDFLNSTPQNISTKLKNLYSKGFVLRIEETAESGGKEFVYCAIGPSD